MTTLAAEGGAIPGAGPRITPMPFREALDWAKGRGVVLPDVYYGELQGFARAQSFSIAGITQLDQLQAVRDSLADNLASGETMREWQDKVRAGKIGLDLPMYRLETIYRTAIQGSYARGRCEQQARAIKAFPWFMYDAINDSRTRPAHAAMDGFVARYDDPVWDTWTPPCGYNCRCRRIALSEKQAAHFQAADARRMEDPDNATARAAAQPDKGWDYSPCTDPEEGTRRAIEAKRATADHRLMESLDNAIWREAARAKTVAPALAPTVTAASSVAEIVAWLNQLAELPQDEPEVIDATAQAEDWISAAEAREAAKETA